MTDQLMTLLEIQDLRSKIRELEAGDTELDALEEEHFNIDVGEAVSALRGKVDDLEGALDPGLRRRYQRVKDNIDRVVVPVINGVCYGCFVSIATSVAGTAATGPRSCENCGRFIYVLS